MKPLLILTGPTAVGKTKLSLGLARAVKGEIISADSMQVYRKMDIGSAKIRPDQMEGIRHHLIDVLDPAQAFDVVRFQQMAKEAMEQIWKRNHIPILTGGTGFYIQSVLYDIDFTSHGEDCGLRRELEEIARREGAPKLHRMLKERDPDAAAQIHPHNVRRVIRALEYHQQTGKQISAHNREQRERKSPYRYLYFVLNEPRELLYQKIEQRVDQMMEEGLAAEVETLYKEGYTRGMTSMQGLGYKELLSWLEGEIYLEEAVRILKRDTRHFAKRQLTWFRREKDVIWIEKEKFDYDEKKILDYMLTLCKKQGIYENEG